MVDERDRIFMRRALALAKKGAGLASPNPPVGCVIVRRGKVVGQSWHEYQMRDHAEVRALAEAAEASRGATAYLTLEPCSHQGRTPPCVVALIKAGIRRVVAAVIDPNPRVSGKGIAWLRSAGVAVDVGLIQQEAAEVIEPFACHVKTGRPLVVSKVGMSLDGRIGTAKRTDHWITSPRARGFGQSLRCRLDAVLVGVGTAIADDPELSYRGAQPKGRALIRVVIDSGLRTPASARMFRTDPPAPVMIFCAPGAAKKKRRALEDAGAEIVSVPVCASGLDLSKVLDVLGARDVLGVLVEGGSEIHWSFLSAGLVDKFYFILAPLVLGGKRSVPSIGGKGHDTIAEATRFRFRRKFFVGPDLVLETYPSSSRSILSPWLA